ncbi:DUF3987 domain-containing protein [Pseudoxanthobacter sp. M-2]|uniref:DUF3987 domain-containing protein n=1 Tax=Pseudoxanthobacter sp. M-2 TaxID=3078754 RepID=UPI0038FC1A19
MNQQSKFGDDAARVCALRHALWANGYRPVPVKSASKAPHGVRWPERARQTPPECVGEGFIVSPRALSTGILADGLQAIDIDIDDPVTAAAVEAIAHRVLGGGPTRYRADSPRMLILYRAAEGEPKKRASACKRIEVLGRGQQFLADGAHPAGAQYEWRGGSPETTALAALTLVTESMIADFLVAVDELLGECVRPPAATELHHGATVPEPAAVMPAPRPGEAGAREIAFADAALQGNRTELAACSGGHRNDLLNAVSYRMGRMVRAGWIDRAVVEGAFMGACTENGLIAEDGYSTVVRTLQSGLESGMAVPHEPLSNSCSTSVPSATADWDAPDLTVLTGGRRSSPQFDVRWLGDVLGEWAIIKAEGSSTAIDYVVVPLLALAGAMLANVRWPLAGSGWKEPPLLWAAIVGHPSSGKSPAMSSVVELVREAEAKLGADHEDRLRDFEVRRLVATSAREKWEAEVRKASEEGKMDAVPPKPAEAEDPDLPERQRVILGDATIEKQALLAAGNPRGLLMHRDELSGWLASFGRYGSRDADLSFALESYGGRFYTVDRVKHPVPIVIRRLSIGVLGGIQPDKLNEALRGAEDGFIARFLWAWPDVLPELRIARGLPFKDKAEPIITRLADLEMGLNEIGEPQPVVVPLTSAAIDALERFGREVVERANNVSGLYAGTLGKARGHALRLSCIIEFLWWASGPPEAPPPTAISLPAVVTACAILDEYFLPMAERVLGDAVLPDAERDAMTLGRRLREIARSEGKLTFNARDLRRKIGGPFREAKVMSAACDVLEEGGLIRKCPSRAGGTKGRQKADYEINPALGEVA